MFPLRNSAYYARAQCEFGWPVHAYLLLFKPQQWRLKYFKARKYQTSKGFFCRLKKLLYFTLFRYCSRDLRKSTIMSLALPTIVAKIKTPHRYVTITNTKEDSVWGEIPLPTVVRLTVDRKKQYTYCSFTLKIKQKIVWMFDCIYYNIYKTRYSKRFF